MEEAEEAEEAEEVLASGEEEDLRCS